MKFKFPLIAILLLLMTASCSETDLQEEQSLYTEQDNNTPEAPALKATPFEDKVFDAINEYRESKGLNKLAFSSEAYTDAEEHTLYMIEEGKLSHDNFNARAAEVSKKTNAAAVAENVAKNYTSAQTVLEAWLASNAHKNTIEGDFTHSTITAREDANGTLYFTQIFFKI